MDSKWSVFSFIVSGWFESDRKCVCSWLSGVFNIWWRKDSVGTCLVYWRRVERRYLLKISWRNGWIWASVQTWLFLLPQSFQSFFKKKCLICLVVIDIWKARQQISMKFSWMFGHGPRTNLCHSNIFFRWFIIMSRDQLHPNEFRWIHIGNLCAISSLAIMYALQMLQKYMSTFIIGGSLCSELSLSLLIHCHPYWCDIWIILLNQNFDLDTCTVYTNTPVSSEDICVSKIYQYQCYFGFYV